MSDPGLPDQFRKMEPQALQALMNIGGVPTAYHRAAIAYISEHYREERSRNLASQSWHKRTALSANLAAWSAAIAAIIAAAAAIITVILELRN